MRDAQNRKALVVGINYYEKLNSLHGCVNDARNVKSVLKKNDDKKGSKNFHIKLLTSTEPGQEVKRNQLRAAIQDLFQGNNEVALFYFAGHGHIETTGGYLCPSDSQTGNDGIAIGDIMAWANESGASDKVIMLDCCHSGIAGKHRLTQVTELTDGVTILTASKAEQYAMEKNGSGVFTNLLVDALSGSAANLVGEVTPGSVYAHIDQSLGPWAQRPEFKTNVERFVSLRKVRPALKIKELKKITDFFPTPGYEYPLDPAYEPVRCKCQKDQYIPPDPKKNKIFAILQKYNRVNLVVPVGAPHMWHAAMYNKACKLTALGEHYRRLVEEEMI